MKREQRDAREKEEAKESGKKTFKDYLKEKNEIRDKLKTYNADLNAAEKTIADIDEEERVIMKNVNPKYRSAEAVNKKISDLTNTMSTTSLRPDQEKEMHKEISFLRKSLSFVERLDTIKPRKDEAYDKKKAANKAR